MDVIHSGQNSFTLYEFLSCVLFLSHYPHWLLQPEFQVQCHRLCAQCVRERADHPTEDIFTCVHAHSARLARVCVAGLELGRDTGLWPGQCTLSSGARDNNQISSISIHHRACIKLNTNLPENTFKWINAYFSTEKVEYVTSLYHLSLCVMHRYSPFHLKKR